MSGRDTLSRQERAELERCEGIIGAGLEEFRRVGEALAAVRDGRLYRAAHATFADYLRVRWDLSRSRAYQLITAAEVAAEVSTNGGQGPANERQARPLDDLPDAETRQQAWQAAVDTAGGKQPTAAQVSEAVEKTALAALAKLSPEDQLRVFQEEEDRVAARAAERRTREQQDERGRRIARARAAHRKAVKWAKGLGGEADAYLEAMEAAEAELDSLEAAG